MEYKGFLRWWLGTPREWIRNPYFWSAILVWTGLILSIVEASSAGKIILAGTMLFAVAFVADWVRVSYKLYCLERERIVDRLKR